MRDEQVTITATMVDGTCIVETTSHFGEFASIVLAFKRDPDTLRVVWHVAPASVLAEGVAA